MNRGEIVEEKKTIKISLSTFFLILAIIAICVMGFFIYKLNDEKTTTTEQVSQLNNQIANLEDTVKSLQEENNNVSNNDKTTETDVESNITDISDIEKLLKNKGNYEYLRIKNIKEDNGKYLVEADYYVPTPITEKEYSEMVNNKKVVLNNKEYIFDNSNEAYNTGYGYVYIEGELVENGYWIEKTNEGYIFIHEIGGAYNIINEIKEHYLFYLDKNIEVSEVASDNENVDLNKYLSKNENLAEFFTTVVYDTYNNELSVVVDKR